MNVGAPGEEEVTWKWLVCDAHTYSVANAAFGFVSSTSELNPRRILFSCWRSSSSSCSGRICDILEVCVISVTFKNRVSFFLKKKKKKKTNLHQINDAH
jgi:hypothetical protein